MIREGTEQPNLIATAIRVVENQTGLSLAKCKKWSEIATFVYNRDDSVDPISPPLEYSKVFLPDIWSIMDDSSLYGTIKTNVDNEKNSCINDKNVVDNDIANTNSAMEVDSAVSEKHLVSTESSVPTIPLSNDSSLPTQQEVGEVSNIAQDSNEANNSTSTAKSEGVTPSDKQEIVSSDIAPMDTTSADDEVVSASNASISTMPSLEKPVDSSAPSAGNASAEVLTTVDSSAPGDSQPSENATANNVGGEVSGVDEQSQALLARLNDLKVAELKAELEKRGVKTKSNLKKADLIAKLKEVLSQPTIEDDGLVSDEVKGTLSDTL